MGKTNKYVLAGITAIFVLILVLGTLEVGFRLFFPQTQNVYKYNQDYIFEFRPNAKITYANAEFSQFSQFNSHGFKDHEYDYENKPNDAYRIMVLGDSFTVGLEVGLNETYVKILEEKLNGEFPKKKVEVMSTAVNGWSTEQELLFLETKGSEYDPDLVVLAYYVGNDQIDNVGRQIFNYDGKDLSINEKRPFWETRIRSVYYFFSTHFHAFNFFLFNYWKIKGAVSRSSDVNYDDALVQYLQKNDSESVAYSWQKTFALLDRMHSGLSQKDVPMMILIIPDRLQEMPDYRAKLGLDDSGLVLNKPQKLLIDYAKSRKIGYIDLLPAFQAHNNETLHYQSDFHWNAAGHALAAQETSTKLINYLRQG